MRWTRAVAIAAIVICFLPATRCTGQESAERENRRLCKDADPDIRIVTCTALIKSGQESNENLAVAFISRGIAYRKKKQYDLAIKDYDQAIRLNPSDSAAFDDRGIAYKKKKQYDRAIGDYDQAIRLNPNDAHAFANRGSAYDDKRQYDRAINDFDKASSIDPNYANAFNGRCWTRALSGDLERALPDCNESLRLRPDDADTLGSRGLVYLKMKEFDLAIADYSEALTRSTDFIASSLYGRGLAERAIGKSAEADRDVAAAKRVDPGIADEFSNYGASAR